MKKSTKRVWKILGISALITLGILIFLTGLAVWILAGLMDLVY